MSVSTIHSANNDVGGRELERFAVWVGSSALAGLAAQTRTVMILYLDEAFHAWHRAGRMKAQHDLFESITHGAVQCVLPKR